MTRTISLTRRLTLTVLILELLSAIALIGAISAHERHTQFKAFDATLQGNADSLMGAVQDSEDTGDDVLLDMRGVQLGRDAVFVVKDERGRVLGSRGGLGKQDRMPAAGVSGFWNMKVNGRGYRLIVLHGLRIVDPGDPGGGVQHRVTVVYGEPVWRVWHRVLEAVRFFAIATAILLGLTAAAMIWLLRRGLSPLHELAQEAERITPMAWQFEAPLSAKETSELRPLAQALESALARLQVSFEQQRRFTSDAAHELKTDVAIVKSSLQLLSMRKRTAEEYGRGLALSLDDFTRLEMTVQKMLTLARLEQPPEADSEAAASRTCSLRDAVEEAVHLSRSYAELRGVQVEMHLTGDAQVPIDSRDAVLLCSNIVLNALQHSPDHSTISIEMLADQEKVFLKVRDEGEGIEDEERQRLFEPFYRGDPSRSRKSGGTGLGLSICKAICVRSGGAIEIGNRTTRGAIVTITLPAKLAAASKVSSGSLKQ